MNKIPRRYEKVDDHVIKIIVEKAEDVPVAKLVENKQKLEGERDRIVQVIKNIDEMLEKAKELGITPEPKAKKIVPVSKKPEIKE